MATRNQSHEFTRDAAHRIAVPGHPVRELSRRLGVRSCSLCKWLKPFAEPSPKPGVDHEAENRRPEREPARATEGRGILRQATACFARASQCGTPSSGRIAGHRGEFGVRAMCRVLRDHISGFHAWLDEPFSHRAQEDARQTELIRQA